MGKKVASEDDGARAAKKAKVAVARKAAAAKSKGKKKSSQKKGNTVKRKTGEGKAVTTEYRVSKVTGMRKREVSTSAGNKEIITEYELWWVGYPKPSWEKASNVNQAGKSNLQCRSHSFSPQHRHDTSLFSLLFSFFGGGRG